jgi:hypothetical protein
LDVPENCFLRCLLELATDDELVQYVIRFVKIEDQIELAYVAEIPIENLHKEVDRVESHELVVGVLDATDEIQTRVPLVDELELLPLDDVAGLRRSPQYHIDNLPTLALHVTLGPRSKPLD